MRIYKFICCQRGLQAIREKRLKISTLDLLNDPFEYLPFDLSNAAHRRAAVETKKEMTKLHGILCFSEYCTNPVIWAHYAESHAGLCLGFDMPESRLRKSARRITYISTPPPFPDNPDISTTEAMLFNKFEDWKYEAEVRILTSVTDSIGGIYFIDFDTELELAEVILGAGCSLSKSEVEGAISGKYPYPLVIRKARREYAAFKMAVEPWF